MNMLANHILSSPRKLAMPIAVYPGADIIGATVEDIVTSSEKQFKAQYEIHKRYSTWIVQSAMDLSVEAEAFGSEIEILPDDIPVVRGRLLTNNDEIDKLVVPDPGTKRTQIYLDTIARLSNLDTKPFVLAGMIGPFSLAGRLFGVSESLEMTMTDPDVMHTLLGKSCEFLTAYAKAFKDAGADGILIAEPTAGLLSPRALDTFSSAYVKKVNDALSEDSFSIVLHNCAARINHIPAVLESGVSILHFGEPMDISKALMSVPETTVLCGNLDPAEVFLNATEQEITNQTEYLLQSTSNHKNFVISSGCDIPPGVTMNNLDAFYKAVQNYTNEYGEIYK